jgi:hypothetical protein
MQCLLPATLIPVIAMSKLVYVPFPRIRIAALADAWHNFLNNMRDPYRPELHYMRGPGPKWWAKRQGGNTA